MVGVSARRAALFVGTAVSVGSAACASDVTSVIVVVDSDLSEGGELSRVRARVGPNVNDFLLDDEPRITLPFSFVVRPLNDDASRPLSIVLEAFDADRTFLFARTVETGFREGLQLRLPLFLARQCLGVSCPEVNSEPQTCTENGCQPVLQDPNTLIAIEPGEEI